MKKLLLTILLNVLLLLPVVGWGGLNSNIRYGKWRSGEAVGYEIGASEGMPSGNEPGANEFWIPGGKTAGGIVEATVDQIQPGTFTKKPVF